MKLFQLKQIVTMNPEGGSSKRGRGRGKRDRDAAEAKAGGGGTMLRVLGAAQKREVKATQNLSIIVLFFMICWIPLYTINCIKAFCPACHIDATWTDFCIILSHLNSAVNPLLYAYHLRDFRAALKSLIYKIFGMKETNPPCENYYKPSIVSHTQRNQSCMEKRSSAAHTHNQQPKIYVDSPVWLRQHAQEVSPPEPASPEPPLRREMWMISEVPSLSEKEISQEGVATISRSGGSRTCLQVPLDDSDPDDDVFLPSPMKLISVAQYDFGDENMTELPFGDKGDSGSPSSESAEYSDSVPETSVRDGREIKRYSSISSTRGDSPVALSYSSTVPTIFCIDNDKTGDLKRSPKYQNISELPKIPFRKTEHISESSTSSSYERSPTKSLRLSPLKIVGDFLFNQTSNNKILKRNTMNGYKSKKRHTLLGRSSSDVVQYLDLHRNGSSHPTRFPNSQRNS